MSLSSHDNHGVQPTVAKILRVIDGDTYLCAADGEHCIVRLSGVDCYEASKTTKLRAQAARAGLTPDAAKDIGIQARLFATVLLTGKTVELRSNLNGDDRDRYGRFVREVWLDEENVAVLMQQGGYVAL